MKLTSEGAARLGRHESRGFPVGDFEFRPEDFDGGCFQNGKDHVVLTVDEVFTLKQMVHFVLNSSRLNNTNKSFLETTYNFLNERFEKTEKGNETK